MFGVSAPFDVLWGGDDKALAKFFPAQNEERPFDNSSAEFALASHLAFWTGCNPVRMEHIMMSAPLCARGKWQENSAYRKRTIAKIISDPNRPYIKVNERRSLQVEEDILIGMGESVALAPNLNLDEMVEYLVHIGDGGQLVDRRTKTIRSRDDASLWYIGCTTEMATGKVRDDGSSINKIYKTLDVLAEFKRTKIRRWHNMATRSARVLPTVRRGREGIALQSLGWANAFAKTRKLAGISSAFSEAC